MLTALPISEAAVRSPLALLASFLAVAACSPRDAAVTPFLADNRVNIDVRCSQKEVTVTVNPWTARAATDEAMEWHIAGGAHVTELEINPTVAGNWPYKEPLPYKSTTDKPAHAEARVDTFRPGLSYRYTISGTCKHGTNPDHRFVIDPDMIIF